MHRFIAYDYSRADWNSLRNHLRDVPWKDIFKFTASAASEFYEWVQVGIEWDPYLKYQAKSHTHLHVFQLLALRAILCRNHFFVCVNRINLLKLKFRQASNRCKKFLKLPNLHMLIK